MYEQSVRNVTELRELANEAMRVFEEAGNEFGLTVAWTSRVLVEQVQGSRADVAGAAECVIEHALRADYRLYVDWANTQLVHARYEGATPREECRRWLDEHADVESDTSSCTGIASSPCSAASTRRTGCWTSAADRLAERGLGATFWISLAWRRFEVATSASE